METHETTCTYVHTDLYCQKLSAKDPKINASHFATSNYAIFDTLNVDYIDPFPDKGYILNIVTLEGNEEGSLKAQRSWLVRVESRRYASNFCKAAQTS